jgi:hypothetical protein
MSICADYAASEGTWEDHETIPSTDLPPALRYAREPLDGCVIYNVPAVVLSGLPVASPDATLPDLLEFRERRKPELDEMRLHLRQVVHHAAGQAPKGQQHGAAQAAVTAAVDAVIATGRDAGDCSPGAEGRYSSPALA